MRNNEKENKKMTDKQAAAELEKIIIIVEQAETKEKALEQLRRIQELLKPETK